METELPLGRQGGSEPMSVDVAARQQEMATSLSWDGWGTLLSAEQVEGFAVAAIGWVSSMVFQLFITLFIFAFLLSATISLPSLNLPDLSLVPAMILPALAIAIIALVTGAGVSSSIPNPDGNYPALRVTFVDRVPANCPSAWSAAFPWAARCRVRF